MKINEDESKIKLAFCWKQAAWKITSVIVARFLFLDPIKRGEIEYYSGILYAKL